jgi:predicted anti-sigma-YlaC factor YlaD
MNHDELAQLDAAYVLGALDEDDSRGFEEHLRSCPRCSRAVRELVDMPRLLAHVDQSVFLSDEDSPAVPETLLPGLLREVRRTRRRQRAVAFGGAAAAVVLAVTGAVVWTQYDGRRGDEVTAQPRPNLTPMRQVDQDSVRASLGMEEVAWGTRLELTCTYVIGRQDYATEDAASYTLAVQTGNGEWQQVATWRAVPGRTITVSAATAAAPDEISSVEIRTPTGRPLLELDP